MKINKQQNTMNNFKKMRIFQTCLILLVVSANGYSQNLVRDNITSEFLTWKASSVLDKAEIILLGRRNRGEQTFPNIIQYYEEQNESRDVKGYVFSYAIHEVIGGVNIEAENIYFVQPVVSAYYDAGLSSRRRSILFIRKMTQEERMQIKKLLPEKHQHLADENDFWTFATAPIQWASHIALSNEEFIDFTGMQIRSVGVKEPEEVIKYIRGLVELRQKVINGEELPAPEGLDRFQRDILQNTKRPETAEQKP